MRSPRAGGRDDAGAAMDGILNVYKERGFTSHDVVAKLRGICRQRKIGHTGTLDPEAEGVLPVCFGRATKICDFLTDQDKVYEAVLLLGKMTDTQDISGRVLSEREVSVTEEEINRAAVGFVGKIDQVPPMYSALKVDGKKLYQLAREGKEVERKARPVTVYSLEILEIRVPRVRFLVNCSKGTYIRTLCQDIGEVLGCGGCMEGLVRTRVGRFEKEDSLRLSEIEALLREGELASRLTAPDSVFAGWEKRTAREEFEKLLYNGNALPVQAFQETSGEEPPAENIRVYDKNGVFIGVYEYREEKNHYRPRKMFYPYG